MRYLDFGNTGLSVSEVGFGGIPIIRLGSSQAQTVLLHALDRGVNLIDTANMYLDSEDKIGQALAGRRQQVVLASKTLERRGGPATAHLEQSLKKLATDYVDIYQCHQVSKEAELETLLGPDGAYEALAKAKEQGKIRHIGVSSHSLEMAVKLAQSGLFASVQFPFNFIETAAADELLPKAKEEGLGFLAMKPFAGGMINSAKAAFAFLRQYPDCIPIPGFDTIDGVDQVLNFYEKPNIVDQETQAETERIRQELGGRFCRRCEYCQPCPQGVKITPAMMYRVVSIRMSPATAVKFCESTMESVRLCADCGECLEKCPYGLPIPDMLREHLALYESHRALGGAWK
jgi:hypothetical protein